MTATSDTAAVMDTAENDGRLLRAFSVELEAGEGRTIDARIVPYGVPAEVSDFGRRPYTEEWVAGCFDDQLRAANRVDVLMNFEHHQGLRDVIGCGVALRSDPDGLHGSFRIFDGTDGDKALELVHAGVLGGISLEAYAKKSIRSAAGVVQRIKAHLDMVALCRRPAFADARVLAVREQVIFDEELLPIPIDPELLARCEKLGIAVPQAHPADGHPGEAGTPADDTRQDTVITS